MQRWENKNEEMDKERAGMFRIENIPACCITVLPKSKHPPMEGGEELTQEPDGLNEIDPQFHNGEKHSEKESLGHTNNQQVVAESS